MLVVVVDTNKNDRELAVRFLSGAGHTVATAVDFRSAQATVTREFPELVVLDPSSGISAAITFIKSLRTADSKKHPHVLLMSPKLPNADLVALLAAGADDFMRKPIDRDELVVRAGVPERVSRWAKAVFGANSIMPPAQGKDRIQSLHAWTNLPVASAKDIGQLLGAALVPSQPTRLPTKADFTAWLVLTMASQKLEIRFRVEMARAHVEHAAAGIFGPAQNDDDSLHDVVRELANIVAGGFKGAAANEAVQLTMGLPADAGAAKEPEKALLAEQVFTVHDSADKIAIGVGVEIRSSPLRMIRVTNLKEGMVLTRDVLNANGAMMVPAGRLSQLRIARVHRVLEPDTLIEVANVDASM